MTGKKVPQRQCVGCRCMNDKKALMRVALNEEGKLFADRSGRAPGRGAYLCCREECLDKAIKSHALERAFDIKLSAEAYEILRNEMKAE